VCGCRYQSREDESRRAFERALRVDEGQADAWLGLGKWEMRKAGDAGALKRAEDLYGRSLSLVPDNEQALFEYGRSSPPLVTVMFMEV
jgi:tetratricopeptide (TPR) repeat protein